jgi:DNA replication protein DnaC
MRLADLRGVKGQIEALEASQRLLGAKATWALFYGDKGVGKTRILMTLVNEWRLKGVWATYTVAERLLAALRSTFDPGSTSGLEEARSRYVRADILAVDEIDRVNWTDWAGEQLFSILNERDMRFRGTYFASNVHPSEWVEKSEPMAALKSRASSGEMVHVSGEDLRPRLQEEFEV